MRTIDLILMLNDFKKNNRVFVETKTSRLAVVDLEVKDEAVFLKTSTKLRGLKNWEFLLMLNKRELYTYPVFYEDTKKHQQLFGFRVADDCILLG
ncbi:MAG: hypothetical protein LKH35_03820 [Companilactobacillus sp.]|nr:hypothetical protein [Companilactobacillus sp.]MCI1487267.1 hypothetical protein [Companilactobacillus sp.]MCI1561590.1 hypothetical protein [Companilactobacillus sp.]MCI1616073.1 hypothetical protein [Companilactobacillus sp.]MCI1619884.1 hypothetical protein [Companilactobacillus sp.]